MGFVFLFTEPVFASTFVLQQNEHLIGTIEHTYSDIGESIDEVGRRFNIGYYEMVHANPRADARHELPVHTPLIVPAQFIIPDVPRHGIVINLAEFRLYYFLPDENIVLTFPVGVGRKGWDTPLGVTRVTAKVVNPEWHPTAQLQAAAEEMGVSLPTVFPAGVNNPLGAHVLRLGWPAYLIHGSNRVDGIGARVSAGCIRMLPDDVAQLFSIVPVGTPVRVINEPVKLAVVKGDMYLQIYPDSSMRKNKGLRIKLANQLKKYNLALKPSDKVFREELLHPSGIVRKVSVS